MTNIAKKIRASANSEMSDDSPVRGTLGNLTDHKFTQKR